MCEQSSGPVSFPTQGPGESKIHVVMGGNIFHVMTLGEPVPDGLRLVDSLDLESPEPHVLRHSHEQIDGTSYLLSYKAYATLAGVPSVHGLYAAVGALAAYAIFGTCRDLNMGAESTVALMTAAAVTHGVPDMKAKFYAATQTIDEARHVEAYDRYVNKIAIHYPMVPWLKQLVDVTLNTCDFHKVMIGMNMIIEGLALGAFNNMYKQTSEPLLKSITFNVMRDESRHVSFGHVYLTPVIAKLHIDDREDLAQFAFEAVKILVEGQMQPMDAGFVKVLEVSGIEVDDFVAGMKEANELGITRDLPPGQIHSLQDLMMPALVRAGLVTARTSELFTTLGVPVDVDLGVLEAMEDRGSEVNVLNAEGADY